MVDHERLSAVLVDFARTLVAAYSPHDILERLCASVPEILPVDGAGVMLTDDAGDLRFIAASDEVIRSIEALQIELGEGPCLRAYLEGAQVEAPDLEADQQFPRFGARARAQGLRGVYSYPMQVVDEPIGALNLYTSRLGHYGEQDRQAGQLLADVATGYLVNARALERSTRLTAQLEGALSSRVVIEQAKGMLAERHGLPLPVAFERMRQHARSHGRKLRTVAEEIVRGTLEIEDHQ